MPISGDILLPYLLAGGCWCDHGHIVATSVIALGSETIGIWGHSFFFADPATTWRIILVTSKQSYRSLVALTHVRLGETTVIMPPIAGLQKTATLRKKKHFWWWDLAGRNFHPKVRRFSSYKPLLWVRGISTPPCFITHRIFHHYPTIFPLSHHVPIATTRKIT